MKRRIGRPGYTLLEVLLAVAMSTLLLAALYYAIKAHMGLADAGRTAVSNSTLTRHLFLRIGNDVSACLTLVDPNRYKDLAAAADAAASGTMTGSMTGTMTGAMTGGMTGTMTGTMTGMSGTMTGMSGTMTGMSGTMTGMTSGTMTGTTTPMTGAADTAAVGLAKFPLGLIGDANTLHLFVSKVPLEVYERKDRPAELTSDLRRISYWIGQKGGLCRVEIKIITSDNACTPSIPTNDEDNCLLAPEVVSIEFSYFDGTSGQWTDTWDSTANADEDGENFIPVGPPRAVAIKIGYVPPGAKPDQIKYQRHVVAIPAANGKQENDQGAFP